MSDREDLAKGLDAVMIALGDISKRLKTMPDQSANVCPACGESFQSWPTMIMHVSHKHREWIVLSDPEAPEPVHEPVVERKHDFEWQAPHELVPVKSESLKEYLKKKFGAGERKPRPVVERDWSSIIVGAIVVVVVLAFVVAFLL